MKGLRLPGNGSAPYQEFFTGNAANFCMELSASRAQIAARRAHPVEASYVGLRDRAESIKFAGVL
jgi:hypothetical protein